MIAVPFWVAGKLAVYQAMREAGITNVELAKRLGVTEAVIRRFSIRITKRRTVSLPPPSPYSGKNL